MNRDAEDVAEAIRGVLRHRIVAHQAALRAADALGWPAILATSVAETHARLAEAQAALLEVDQTLEARRATT